MPVINMKHSKLVSKRNSSTFQNNENKKDRHSQI